MVACIGDSARLTRAYNSGVHALEELLRDDVAAQFLPDAGSKTGPSRLAR